MIGSGAASIAISRSETILAWQAWIMSSPRVVAAEHLAVDQAHAAGAADAGAAVVRKIDAVHQRPVEQQVAAIREKRLVVDASPCRSSHYSTSRRMGRTCLVCLIWL